MTQIDISKSKEFPQAAYEVTVQGNPVTKHRVSLTKDYYEKLTGGTVPPEKLVEASFVFLLAREPNTSILSEFDLAVISSYFPAYEPEMKNKFQTGV